MQHILGSDELSSLSPPVASVSPKPYVLLHPSDAQFFGVAEGDSAALQLARRELMVQVRVHAQMRWGVAGLWSGLSGQPVFNLPAWATLAGKVAP
jgi:NADH-quinone oxidoreductase subunit G